MLDINWLILAYAGIFLAGVGVLILCISTAITLGTVRKSITIATECAEDVTNVAEEALVLAKDLNNSVKKVEGNLEPIMAEANILLQNTNTIFIYYLVTYNYN